MEGIVVVLMGGCDDEVKAHAEAGNPMRVVNRLFSHGSDNEKAGGNRPAGLLGGEKPMRKHRPFLRRTVVKIEVKVKLTIIQR
ncbi:MAG TPA: hypothetical protein VHB27_22855 [Rhodopila sp.]|uniref:hypothetical protein n=1 Tax=Rhodopila sp. TaxID=2480087 RepID=UPI002C1EE4F8|nr:hypothetical protein [Rhodopila sp.]HVY18077.1 hypothetical protein [Rhodopila sp.]